MFNLLKKHIGAISAFILTTILLLIIFYESGILRGTILISDLNAEYQPLLMQVRRILTSQMGIFNLNTGMGDNFIGTFYYYMSSPLNILTIFIKNINLLVIILVTLKLSLSSMFAYLFLRCLCDEDDELFQHIYTQYLEFNQSYEVDDNYLAKRKINEKKWVFNCFSKFVPNSVSTAFVDDVTFLISKSLGYKVILNQSVIKQYIDRFGFKYIKERYKKHFGKMNATSMCLLHHPDIDYDNISLLTGDAVFDSGMLKFVNDYLNDHFIRYFQVPHHGAIKEWHLLNGLEKKCLFFYISFGLGNRYTHPSSQVISAIIAMGKNPNLSYQSNAPYFYNNEYYI